MKTGLKIGGAILAVIIIGVLIFASQLGAIVAKGIEEAGPHVAKVETKVDDVSISLLGGSASMQDLFVGNPKGYKSDYAMKVSKIAMELEPKSLKGDSVHINSIEVRNPMLNIEGASLHKNNLRAIEANVKRFVADMKKKAGIKDGGKTAEAKSEDGGKEKKLIIDSLVITGGKATLMLSSGPLAGKSIDVDLPDINMKDIGKKEGGITAGELTSRIIGKVNGSVFSTIGGKMGELIKDFGGTAADIGKKAGSMAGDAAKGIGGLFGK